MTPLPFSVRPNGVSFSMPAQCSLLPVDTSNPWQDAMCHLACGLVSFESVYCVADLMTRLDHWPHRDLEVHGIAGRPIRVAGSDTSPAGQPVAITWNGAYFLAGDAIEEVRQAQHYSDALYTFLLAVLVAVDMSDHRGFPAPTRRLTGESAVQQMEREMYALTLRLPPQDLREPSGCASVEHATDMTSSAVAWRQRNFGSMSSRPRLRSKLLARLKHFKPELALEIDELRKHRTLSKGELKFLAGKHGVAYETVRNYYRLNGDRTAYGEDRLPLIIARAGSKADC